MEWEIHRFIQYLHLVKKTTYNTEVSYERDLRKLALYLKEHNIETFADVTSEELRKYVTVTINILRMAKDTSSSMRVIPLLLFFMLFSLLAIINCLL